MIIPNIDYYLYILYDSYIKTRMTTSLGSEALKFKIKKEHPRK